MLWIQNLSFNQEGERERERERERKGGGGTETYSRPQLKNRKPEINKISQPPSYKKT
jgi:hypothetical protein